MQQQQLAQQMEAHRRAEEREYLKTAEAKIKIVPLQAKDEAVSSDLASPATREDYLRLRKIKGHKIVKMVLYYERT